MRVNVIYNTPKTHEGGKSMQIKPLDRLKRLVLACMLWENNFYENGVKVADAIEKLCKEVEHEKVLYLAREAHGNYKLRHIPLFLIIQALKHPKRTTVEWDTIQYVCSRPDQMSELIALYWKEGKKALPAQLKKGLAKAFHNFDEYQFAKWDRDSPIKLRDVMFLCHPKPKDKEQEALFKRIVERTLKTPDTWEVRLSSGADKKESFQELLKKSKMGGLAILRNLRNMVDTGINPKEIEAQLISKVKKILPFQFIAAAKECPQCEQIIDKAMIKSMQDFEKIPGKTYVIVDVSGSMDAEISSKSKTTRLDAACAFAILLRECCETAEFLTFSNEFKYVPARQGMALRDAIVTSQGHSGTYLAGALQYLKSTPLGYDRLIVITDEQIADEIPKMNCDKKYILNIGNNENGIGHKGDWMVINGFAEASIEYIRELEKAGD